MKKINYFLIFIMATVSLFATDRYQYIEEAEYFVNTDPGVGQGIPIDVGMGFSVDIAFNNVPYNYGDILFVRVKNENGVWSAPYGRKLGTNIITDAKAYKVTYPVPNYRKLVEVEMDVAPKLLDGLIATATSDEIEGDNLQPGDTLLIQFKGANGIWGTLQPMILSKLDLQIQKPLNLQANNSEDGGKSVHLSWIDNSDSENEYLIERKDAASNQMESDNPQSGWLEIGRVPKNTNEYIDYEVQLDIEYQWRVKAVGIKEWMNSDYSNIATLLVVGVNENEYNRKMVYIFPNPAQNYIEIPETYGTAAIYSALGIKVMEINNPSGRIDISRLPAGVYYIAIDDRFEKFIKY